jgi:hypothetical protein
MLPAEAVEQDQEETTAVPLVVELVTVLLNEQLFEVLIAKEVVPVFVGVPVAVKTTVLDPMLSNEPDAAKVTPLLVTEIS